MVFGMDVQPDIIGIAMTRLASGTTNFNFIDGMKRKLPVAVKPPGEP
jgi:hypothetical protein